MNVNLTSTHDILTRLLFYLKMYASDRHLLKKKTPAASNGWCSLLNISS
jgi:hypothetical protein